MFQQAAARRLNCWKAENFRALRFAEGKYPRILPRTTRTNTKI
jgi:hypothetical protein